MCRKVQVDVSEEAEGDSFRFAFRMLIFHFGEKYIYIFFLSFFTE